MLHFRRCLWLALTFLMVVVLCQPAIADDETKKKKKDGPWETAAIMGGAFIANVDSGLSLGVEGAGVEVDGEDVLGLDENPLVWRIDGFWRITKRNRLDFMYYDFSRDGDTFLGIEIDDPDNGTIPVGTRVQTKYDYRLAKLTWAYAFVKDDRMEIYGGLGAYILSIRFKLRAEGFGEVENTNFTYPLPVFRLGASFAITDKFILRQHVDFFYLAYKDFQGNLVDLGVNLDWNFWKYAGIGLGYNFMAIEASKDKGDYFNTIRQNYGGLMLYGKLYF